MIDSKGVERLSYAIYKNPKILYEDVLNNYIHTGSLTFRKMMPATEAHNTITIPFLMTDDFSFSLGNSWGQLAPDSVTNIINQIMNVMNGLSMLDNNPYDIQMAYKNKAMGISTYQGSETPDFNINCTFVCTQRSYNPVEIIKQLSAMCLPREVDPDTFGQSTIGKGINAVTQKVADFLPNLTQLGSDVVKHTDQAMRESDNFFTTALSKAVDIAKNGFLYAPLDYKAGWDGSHPKPEGTVTLRIGNWFAADDLVCHNISGIKFSKETVAPPPDWLGSGSSNNIYRASTDKTDWGFPLYATCSIKLKPVTYITYADFLNYFVTATGSKANVVMNEIRNAGDVIRMS